MAARRVLALPGRGRTHRGSVMQTLGGQWQHIVDLQGHSVEVETGIQRLAVYPVASVLDA